MRKYLLRALTQAFGGKFVSDIAYFLKVVRRRLVSLAGRKPAVCSVSCVHLKLEKRHVFFGYYDLCPFHPSDDRHLALAAPLSARGSPVEVAQLGYFRLESPEEFVCFAETRLWNWQMGSRLQWYGNAGDNAVIFNSYHCGKPSSVIQDAENGKLLHSVPIPIYDVAPDGKTAVTLNFFDLQKFRPGYGYVGKGWSWPSEVMVWHVDIESARVEAAVTMKDLLAVHPKPSFLGAKHYVNHLSYSPDGARYLLLHLWSTDNERNVRILTAKADGSDLKVAVDSQVVSHYTWKDAEHLLCFSWQPQGGLGYYVYSIDGEVRSQIGPGLLTEDGHPSFLPRRDALITDTYPDRIAERHLLYYPLGAKTVTTLASYYSPFSARGELRCDLHPRLDHNGQQVSLDSAHAGRREIHVLKFSSGGKNL